LPVSICNLFFMGILKSVFELKMLDVILGKVQWK
jgi:hypothetical protein